MCSVANLFVARFRIAPTQVLGNRAAKQNVLLQHHAHFRAQNVEIVVTHVAATQTHRTVRGIVQTRDELNQRGLRRTSTAHDAHRRAGWNRNVNVRKNILLTLVGVAERNILKLHSAVGNVFECFIRGCYRGFFAQNGSDTAGGGARNNNHDEDEGNHHHSHHNLQRVGNKRGEIARG